MIPLIDCSFSELGFRAGGVPDEVEHLKIYARSRRIAFVAEIRHDIKALRHISRAGCNLTVAAVWIKRRTESHTAGRQCRRKPQHGATASGETVAESGEKFCRDLGAVIERQTDGNIDIRGEIGVGNVVDAHTEHDLVGIGNRAGRPSGAAPRQTGERQTARRRNIDRFSGLNIECRELETAIAARNKLSPVEICQLLSPVDSYSVDSSASARILEIESVRVAVGNAMDVDIRQTEIVDAMAV